MRPSIQARLTAPCTSKAEEVGYWYWIGKLALAKGDVRRVSFVRSLLLLGHNLTDCIKAREYLKKAFDMCPVQAERNLRYASPMSSEPFADPVPERSLSAS
jgi:hypothetical protein